MRNQNSRKKPRIRLNLRSIEKTSLPMTQKSNNDSLTDFYRMLFLIYLGNYLVVYILVHSNWAIYNKEEIE